MENRNLTVLYGSQTGTAQDLAEQIWRESKRYHYKGTVVAMDNYDVRYLPSERCVIFICSTTGQGEEPDNMKTFWKFLLRKSLAANSLDGISFAVFGLGDSSYTKYNFVAKRLNKRLQQLGGHAIVPMGLGDDQHDLGPSAASLPWISNLWEELLILNPLSNGLFTLPEVPVQTRWSIEVLEKNDNSIGPFGGDIFEDSTSAVNSMAEVLDNTRTTSEDHFQDVRLISCSCKDIEWVPGDIFVVQPQNSIERVNELFLLLAENGSDYNADTVVKINEINPEMPVPQCLQRPLKLQTIAAQYWDLNTIPRQRTFELLAVNCKNELEKEKLIEFTKPEGQEELFSYANRPRRTIVEVLADFPHSTSQLNISLLFEIFQSIKPRSFSIASSHKTGKLDILVAVVEYKTILARKRIGLCSNWLKDLTKGQKIRGAVKRGTFKLPDDENIPVVMVGPGTGLAPFRSMLMELEFNLNSKKDCKYVNYLRTLFFGCRGESLDFHCKTDLKRMETIEMLKLFTAFSRDQEDKIYVQHRIKEQQELLQDEIKNKNGYFLVAGNSKNMPNSVKNALIFVLRDEKYVEEMIKSGRYQEETWA